MTEGRPVPFFGDGSSERDYTFIDDILDGVEGALRCVTTGDPAFEIVNLGKSRTVSVARMVELLGGKLGVTPDLQRSPSQPGDVRRTFADVSKARRLLGYEPSTSFEAGLDGFLQLLLQQNAVQGVTS